MKAAEAKLLDFLSESRQFVILRAGDA